MSVNEQNEIFENEEVKGVVTVDSVAIEKNNKKAKMLKTAKTGLKVAGIALLGGIAGFLLGKKSGSKNEYYETEVVESEFIDSDVE